MFLPSIVAFAKNTASQTNRQSTAWPGFSAAWCLDIDSYIYIYVYKYIDLSFIMYTRSVYDVKPDICKITKSAGFTRTSALAKVLF